MVYTTRTTTMCTKSARRRTMRPSIRAPRHVRPPMIIREVASDIMQGHACRSPRYDCFLPGITILAASTLHYPLNLQINRRVLTGYTRNTHRFHSFIPKLLWPPRNALPAKADHVRQRSSCFTIFLPVFHDAHISSHVEQALTVIIVDAYILVKIERA